MARFKGDPVFLVRRRGQSFTVLTHPRTVRAVHGGDRGGRSAVTLDAVRGALVGSTKRPVDPGRDARAYPTDTAASACAGPPGGAVRHVACRGGVLIAFGLMILGFSLARPNTFPTWLDAKAIITAAAPEMIVALGLTVVLVMRDFDLSIGSMVGLADGAAVSVMVQHHVAWPVAVLVGLGLGRRGRALHRASWSRSSAATRSS